MNLLCQACKMLAAFSWLHSKLCTRYVCDQYSYISFSPISCRMDCKASALKIARMISLSFSSKGRIGGVGVVQTAKKEEEDYSLDNMSGFVLLGAADN